MSRLRDASIFAGGFALTGAGVMLAQRIERRATQLRSRWFRRRHGFARWINDTTRGVRTRW